MFYKYISYMPMDFSFFIKKVSRMRFLQKKIRSAYSVAEANELELLEKEIDKYLKDLSILNSEINITQKELFS